MRTRQRNSFVALLSSEKATVSPVNIDYLLVEIKDGRISVTSSTQDGKLISSVVPERVDDGAWVEIVVTKSFVMVNQKKVEKALHSLNIKHVFMGGVDKPDLYKDIMNSKISFDGCLQAVKLGNVYLTSQPITDSPNNDVNLSGVRSDVCKGDDVCASTPCRYGGNCKDVWNDFECQCPKLFAGKTCAHYGCRVNHSCSSDYACIDILEDLGKTRCKYVFAFCFFRLFLSVPM